MLRTYMHTKYIHERNIKQLHYQHKQTALYVQVKMIYTIVNSLVHHYITSHTMPRGLPTSVGNTAFGVPSPEKPA